MPLAEEVGRRKVLQAVIRDCGFNHFTDCVQDKPLTVRVYISVAFNNISCFAFFAHELLVVEYLSTKLTNYLQAHLHNLFCISFRRGSCWCLWLQSETSFLALSSLSSAVVTAAASICRAFWHTRSWSRGQGPESLGFLFPLPLRDLYYHLSSFTVSNLIKLVEYRLQVAHSD